MTAAVSTDLIEAARRGEPTALLALLRDVSPSLRRYAERSCLVSDVDDAVQETLLALSRHIGRLEHVRALSTWLFRSVRRECHRLSRRVLRVDLWDDEQTDAFVAARPPDELRRQVAAALESLPPHYREVIVLRDLEELTIAEIAHRLDEPVPTIKSRLHRARVLTREYLLA